MKKLINEVTFSLPCRVFTINYSVTEKRQLPVVKEFVVRLIYEVESSYPDAIANFFGFNSHEIKEVLEDLIDEGLIQWNEGKVILSSYAQENFTEVNGSSVPRFFEITDIKDTVTFDLFLFKFLGDGISKIANKFISIDVPLPSESYENVIKKVKSAFHAQFMSYQEQVKEIDILSEDSLELYKINHIESSRDQLIPIPVSYYFDDTTQSISLEYDLPVITEWDKERLLFNTIDNAIEIESYDELSQMNNCMSYIGYIQDPFFIKVINDNDKYSHFKLPFSALLEYYISNNSMKNGQQMIIGNLYTKDNREILNKMIRIAKSKKSKNYSNGALLFTNLDDKTWGKTRSLIKLVEIISQTFKKSDSKFVINTHCNNKDKNEVFRIKSKYEISGAQLHSCGNIFDSKQIELLIIPDVLVASLFHYKVEDNRKLSLPIGFVTTNIDSIEKITKEAYNWSNKSQANFNTQDVFQNDGKSIRDGFVLPILKYYDDIEKQERQKIIDQKTNLKRITLIDE